MSAEKLLFNFSRKLPEPFDTTQKKVKVASKYTTGMTESTMNATTLKAILAFCKCKFGTGDGAVGQQDFKTVVEYKSSDSADAYHLVVYDPTVGSLLASVYDKNTETTANFILGNTKRDGGAIMMAMMPELLSDEEFADNFDAFYKEFLAGYPNKNKAVERLGILCDNAYRRVKDEACPAHVKVKIDGSGNIPRVSNMHLDSGHFTPTSIVAGAFSIFIQSGSAPVYKAAATVDNSDFIGKYKLSPSRVLSPYESQLVPVLDESYILPAEVVNICKHAHLSTEKLTPMRNFMLRGLAGTGKTKGAMAIAAGLGLPYMKYTCSTNTEIFDFIGQVFPETDSASTGDADLDMERQTLKSMGGMTYENVAKLMNLPELDDIDYDPAGVYQALTGTVKENATSQDCISLVLNMVSDKIQKLSKVKTENQGAGQTYTYIETDFIKALKHGYLVEIQEPSTIMQPGVLVGLNSLLEQEGSITLPTGEIIKRHPEAIVVVTTNTDYEGCRNMNQSVLDRMNLVADIDLPSPEVMAQRAMSITGINDDQQVSLMVKVVIDAAEYCRKNGITDGSVGMRSLIDWIISTEITNDPYESALLTVISKATSDESDRESIIVTALDPLFTPKRKSTAA